MPVVLLGALAGCGNARTVAPDAATPVRPTAARTEAVPAQGITFQTATNWTLQPGTAPMVAVTSSGQATVAIWRYPRTEPLPRTAGQLRAARAALVGAARVRDPGLKVSAADILRIGRHPAIVLLARERIGGQPRTVRSAHVYAFGSEYVIDAYAPPDDFDVVDGTEFLPLLRSVVLAPVSAATGAGA